MPLHAWQRGLHEHRIPMIAETSGGWGASAICTLKAISRAAATRSDRSSDSILSEQLQLLSAGIRRAKARAVLRRDPGADRLVPHALASAAAVLVEDDPPLMES